MSEKKNPLLDDLEEIYNTSNSDEAETEQPINKEEISQIRKHQLKLKKEPQVKSLAEKIDVTNQIAILEFGKEVSKEMTSFSDRLLSTTRTSKLEKSSKLIQHLNKIMDRFDPKDFQEEKKGLFAKLLGKGEKFQKLFSKYDTMSKEIDAIYNEITKYEVEMKKNTTELEKMYDQNVKFYQNLSEHIAAIELKLEELNPQLKALEEKAKEGNQEAILELETLQNSIQLLEQRRYDLEMAQQVSFQSAPQIRLIQQGNNQLIAKINATFVTTIPIFKQGLIHAVAIKRQKQVADSMYELDKRTNEMLIRNAENIRQNSVNIARISGSPSIKIETIEKTWQTIMEGIQETKQIQDENIRNREEGRKRIEQLQRKYEGLKYM